MKLSLSLMSLIGFLVINPVNLIEDLVWEALGSSFSGTLNLQEQTNTRNDAGNAASHTAPASSSSAAGIAPVAEAVSAAAIGYLLHIPSLNCFEPDDLEFQCLKEDEDTEPDETINDNNPLAAITAEEFNTIMHTQFAQLHVTGSGLEFQPLGDGIIGLDFILATNPEPHFHQTQLFDIPITIRATPVHYLWDMGDGHTISTTDPGKHHPNQTVTHLYEEAGTYAVSLTTTWAGHFTVGDGTNPEEPWFPIAGTITTTETGEPKTHRVYKTKLIPPDY